jgi:hypothetical protein
LFEAMLSNRPPPLADMPVEVTRGAAGGDLGLEKPLRLAKTSVFWGFGGRGGADVVVDGKLNPLNASVNPPRFED